jgi:hypothetical protein
LRPVLTLAFCLNWKDMIRNCFPLILHLQMSPIGTYKKLLREFLMPDELPYTIIYFYLMYIHITIRVKGTYISTTRGKP